MRSLDSLPLDVIDRILLFLPTFSALRAILLSSKSLNTIFKYHPNSIIRAIAYNITGPALPQAMRLLRTAGDRDLYLVSDPPKHALIAWAETDPISPVERCTLVKNAAVVKALEDLFSSRHKDRTSQSSKLEYLESWRFRRAMYRLCLFSSLFSVDDIDFDEDAEPQEIEQERHRRKRLLSDFPDCELREMQAATTFLSELVSWIETCDNTYGYYDSDSLSDLALARGPALILGAYQARSIQEIYSPLDESGMDTLPEILKEYISYPLQKVFEERKLKSDIPCWKSMLGNIHGANDMCHRCGAVRGFDLWNETNWEFLYGVRSTNTASLLFFMKGNLPRSLEDAPLLVAEISAQNFTYTKLLRDIQALRVTPHEAWDTHDWLCEQCITGIIQEHLHLWLLEQKKKSGQQIPENCWYGYNCRTQTHNPHHAKRLNHLCVPTRGS